MRLCPTASAIHLQRGHERFLRDVDLAELPSSPEVPAEHMRCDDGVDSAPCGLCGRQIEAVG